MITLKLIIYDTRIANNSSLTTEMENSFKLVHEQGTRDLLNDAVVLYKTPNLTAR